MMMELRDLFPRTKKPRMVLVRALIRPVTAKKDMGGYYTKLLLGDHVLHDPLLFKPAS